MSNIGRDRVVYDCNVYLQFLLNRGGPSGHCVAMALDGRVQLFISDAVLDELRQLPEKPFCLRQGITGEAVEDFIAEILNCATYLSDVPSAFDHPIDPDDSNYINLAIAAGGELIVSWDKHLLNLTSSKKAWSAEFRARFPAIRILQPTQFLADRQGKASRS